MKALQEHEEEEHVKDEALHDRARQDALQTIRDTKQAELAKARREEHQRLDNLRKRGFTGFDPYTLTDPDKHPA